ILPPLRPRRSKKRLKISRTWVDLDEHIGIEGLLAGRKSGESRQSFERWLFTRMNAAPPERTQTKTADA
ncbi:MAG: hypothetical protein ACO36E_13165, partial [Synechocystis sp.]